MKLRGTITEQEYRKEIIRNHNYLFNTIRGSELKSLLLMLSIDVCTIVLLDWLHDDGYDFYTILTQNDQIVFIESKMTDSSFEPIIERESIKEYKLGLSKSNQIKLAVAIDILQSDLLNPNKY